MWEIGKRDRGVVKMISFSHSSIPLTNIYCVPTMCQTLHQSLRNPYSVNKTEISWSLGSSEVEGAIDKCVKN